MAKVVNPLLSTQASGKASGMIFSNSRGQDIVRRGLRPTGRFLYSQEANRTRLGFLSRQWGRLEVAERVAWEAYAGEHPVMNKFGQAIILTGANCYVKLNHTAIRLGGDAALQVDPPLDDPVAGLSSLSASEGVAEGGVTLVWTHIGTGVATDFDEVQMAGPFGSPAINAVQNKFRYESQVAGNILTVEVTGLTLLAWYWFRVRYVDEFGQTSEWLQAKQTPKVGV